MPVDILGRTAFNTGSLATLFSSNVALPSATTVSGNGFDFGAGGALPAGSPIPFVVRIIVIDCHQTSGGGTVDFQIDHSSDNSTFMALARSSRGANDTITMAGATVQQAEVFIGFYTHQRYIRLSIIVGTTPVGGQITADVSFAPSFP